MKTSAEYCNQLADKRSDNSTRLVSLRWIENNRRKKLHSHECLQVIRVDKISPTFLEHLLETHPVISNDLALYKLMINQHLLKSSKRPDKSKEEIGDDNLIIHFDEDTDCIGSFDPMTEKVEKFHDENFKNLKRFGTICFDFLCKNKSVR